MKAILKNPYWIVVVLIAAASFMLMWGAAQQESATMDELAHIPAGYSYVRYFDYRLNPEHPPLLKALSGLPLLFRDLNFPDNHKAWTSEVNGQWEAGTIFLYESGNDADWIMLWSRLPPILLTLILIFFVYFWSTELLGKRWALLPTLLIAFSPTVLAHGHYVTTDMAAALGVFTASYYLFKYLHKPSRNNLVLACVSFGIAQLTKFSAVLLIPYFIIIVLIHSFIKSGGGWKRIIDEGLKNIGNLAVIFIFGFVLVYAVYVVFVWNYPVAKQVSDTKFILTSFAGGEPAAGETCKPIRCLAELDIWMAGQTAFRPMAQYLLGLLMVIQRAAGGNTAYFLGEVSAAGWWYYFPLVYVLKEPLPALLMIFIAFIYASSRIIKSLFKFKIKLGEYIKINFVEFSMLVFVAGYWAYSINSNLNIGIRHILPTLPFIYILAASAIKKIFLTEFELSRGGFFAKLKLVFIYFIKFSLKSALAALLIIWFLGEIINAYPYYLSYFNKFGDGTFGGYRFVADSNYDWGQDLKRLAEWANKNGVDKIAVDYFGGGNPKYYLGNKAEYWWSARGNPAEQGIRWLAVSINTLQSATADLHPGQQRRTEDEYRWLTALRPAKQEWDVPPPDKRIGTSIFVYKLK